MAKAVAPSSIVFEVLETDNYEDWSETIRAYLEFKDIWDVVESNEQPPDRDADEAMFNTWNKKNSEALHAIKISCGRHFLSKIRGIREANKAWRTLQAYFIPHLPRMEYTINPQQGDEENVDDEYKKAYKLLADALSKRDISDAIIELCKQNPGLLKERLPDCTSLLHQFIMLVSDDRWEDEVDHSSDRMPSDVWTLEDGKYGATVLTQCFQVGRFKFASKLLKQYPQLIFAKDVNGLLPLYVAARAPHSFESHIFLPIAYKFPKFACSIINATMFIFSRWVPKWRQGLRGLPLLKGIELLIAMRNAIRDSEMTSDLLHGAFFEAIKCGNFNFILMLINYDQKNLEEVNDMSKNIYTCAIENRQPKVFSLIFWDKKDRKERRNYANFWEDNRRNNLLHMAATRTPPNTLDRISKPAMLMISEAMWFEEVSKLAPDLKTKVNVGGKIPSELFKESHKDLMMEAEKEMKESANSWAIVGPLVITIMFAAAFQIPGGYNQEMGFPIFLNNKRFKLYMFSISISFFSATFSVLKLLEILSSDHHKKDFLRSLWNYGRTYNMITAYLFSSLASMLLAFCFGLFLTLHGESSIVLPVTLTASLLAGYILYSNFTLLLESFTSGKLKSSLFEKNIGDEVEHIFKMLNEEVAT